jgi:hypothetical protein
MKISRSLTGIAIISMLAVGLIWAQQQRNDWIIGQERAAKKQIDAIATEDRMQLPAAHPDWQKARADASRLLALTQQIHDQIQAGPERVSNALVKELKEIQKLSKELHKDLLL